jgi:hypothetical protein
MAGFASSPAASNSVRYVMDKANVPLLPGFDRYGSLTLTETGADSVLFSASVGPSNPQDFAVAGVWFNVRSGQRIVDSCQHDNQLATEKADKAASSK